MAIARKTKTAVQQAKPRITWAEVKKQKALLKRIWIGSLIVGLLVGIVCSQLPGGLRWAVLTMLVLSFAYRAQRAVVAALYDQIESDQTYLMP